MTQTQTTSKKVSLGSPPDERELDPRSLRARTERMAVTPFGGGVYEVETESGNAYLVDLESGRCTCPDHVMRRERCKHLRRVAIEINEGRVPPPGQKRVFCEGCGTPLFVPENDAAPHFCAECAMPPGSPVVDRETGDLLVVVRHTGRRADEVTIPDRGTVADYPTNRNYPDDDPVVEVLYPLPAGIEPDDIEPRHVRRYSFPLSRLRHPAERDDEQARLSDFAPA